MSSRPFALLAAASAVLTGAALLAAPSATAGTGPATANTGAYVLTVTNRSAGNYAPTFTGNGYLSVRVPPAGQGYNPDTAGGDNAVPSLSELAGFYADPPGNAPTDVQQRGNLPTWSTLDVSDGTATVDLSKGKVSGWRQSIDLHTGVITTSFTWRSPAGRSTDLQFAVSTDRAHAHVGTVQLTMTPHWSGTAAVTDRVDGTPATLSEPVVRGTDPASAQIWEAVRAQGTGITAALATRLTTSAAGPTVTAANPTDPQSVGQRMSFAVQAGRSYTVTKYVGVESTNESPMPVAAARAAASAAASAGYAALQQESTAAWAALWAGRIDVLGNPTLATEVNASQFYLWSSIRDDAGSGPDATGAWSISPAGLSSNGYDGHIFWDAETWMYPSLLAQHPDLARNMDDYRFERLGAAEQHAAQTGYPGARFPWESALDGTEQIPGPVSINSEGLYEQHITADVALAQWQYYLVTGDRSWLATRGWPVLSQAATFWAGRVTRAKDGSYHILGVTGPDEENPNVNDEVYTNYAAAATLRIATAAASVLGRSAPAAWAQIAAGLVVPVDPKLGIHPEFDGYRGQLVKQADVTLLQYPWGSYSMAPPMPASVVQNDLNYYVVRSDPGGPSMTDAVSMIDTAALNSPGCAAYVYTERSIQPFVRDGFYQFSETRTGGAFTFMTGIGGFLQEFLYGYSGLRFRQDALTLDPMLNAGISGIVLHNLQWQGRTFTVSVGSGTTTVGLDSGAPMPVSVRGATSSVTAGHPLTVPTRRPDLRPTPDLVRCGAVSASSAAPGAPALAAVDGSPATDWQPVSLPATLTAPLASAEPITGVTLRWGQQWPGVPGPNIPPPPGPVITLRPTSYLLQVSQDGRRWTTVAHPTGTGTLDTVTLRSTKARWVRVVVTSAAKGVVPELMELTVTR